MSFTTTFIFLECPVELREAISSIIFAAPRCSEVPDLLQIKNLFAAKYGKEFIMAASELRPDSGVNRAIIENLSVYAPSPESRLKVLKEIALEYNLAWDSSGTEAELCKNHEDLLGGSKQIVAQAGHSQAFMEQRSHKPPPTVAAPSIYTDIKQGSQHAPSPSPTAASNLNSVDITKNEASTKNKTAGLVTENRRGAAPQSSDVLERARAAIASAERATAAARAAAELVNAKFTSPKQEERSS